MALSAPVIKSITTDAGTVVGASTNVNELVLHGTAQANSTVNVFDGTTFLGTTAVNSAGAWAFAPKALSDGAQLHRDRYGRNWHKCGIGSNGRERRPNITTSRVRLMRRQPSMEWPVKTKREPVLTLTEPDSHTLRFEVRPEIIIMMRQVRARTAAWPNVLR